jgi:hypothetical protein
MQDLDGQPTMVVWPRGAEGSSLTPSPIMDAFSRISNEFDESKAQLIAMALIQEEPKPQGKSNTG